MLWGCFCFCFFLMGLYWQSITHPWVILMKKTPPLAPCIGGKNCHQGNALIDSWKPNVSFMLMHLDLLKEQDWSHFIALSHVAGSVEQRCLHPLQLKGSESCAVKDIIATQVVWLCHTPNLLSELAHLGLMPWFSFYKSCTGVRIGACWSQSAFWSFTEESAKQGL